MSHTNSSAQPPRDTPSYRAIRGAKASLRTCGCLQTWEEYRHLSVQGKRSEMVILRLRYLIEEQIWSLGDIEGITLPTHSKSEPFPEVVHVCLANKLKIARSNKKVAFEAICEKRKLLEQKHRLCHGQAKKDLNVLFRDTKAQGNKIGFNMGKEINNEIQALIRDSVWAKQVNVDRVCNLTTGEVNTHELELLSLGCDFKLQGSNKTILDTIVAFHNFEHLYRNEPGKPDLQ